MGEVLIIGLAACAFAHAGWKGLGPVLFLMWSKNDAALPGMLNDARMTHDEVTRVALWELAWRISVMCLAIVIVISIGAGGLG
jgi:hypothetical protein